MCWVPDTTGEINLSGKLGHIDSFEIALEYIGPLSRFENKRLKVENDLLVLLSGPEPQRTLLEESLFLKLKNYTGKVIFVKGIHG